MRTLILVTLFFSLPARAQTIDLVEGGSFEAAVEALQPGQTLIVHAGTYSGDGRLSIGARGTEAMPIVIRAAEGEARPHITRTASDALQNTINIEGAAYLTIEGLEISGNGGDGVNLSGTPDHITLVDLEIHDVDVGVNFRSDMSFITVRGCHIHHTGGTRDATDRGTGEGMYVGCNDSTCRVHDAQIVGNWIHDTTNSTQGDGIEIKQGSYANIVRDNVIHDTRYPCILVYDTDGMARNVIDRNAMWRCGDSAIQAAADAIITNNLMLDSPANGFNSQPHQGAMPANLEFVHNTIVGGSPCVRLGSWDGAGLVFANNAIYCPSDSFAIGSTGTTTFAGNAVFPRADAIAGSIAANAPDVDLGDPAMYDVYPRAGSALIGAADPAFSVAGDYNGTTREDPSEAGAYERTADTNPGWRVAPGFRGEAPAVPGEDAGMTTTHDAGVGFDGGRTIDAGMDVDPEDGSCGCSAPRRSSALPCIAIGVLLFVHALRRRR
jgi:hypothetical protein